MIFGSKGKTNDVDIIFNRNIRHRSINRLCVGKEQVDMYSINIYEDFPHGEFKLLETYYCYAHNRAEAKLIALRYAEEKYPDRKISVMNTN